MKHVTTKNNIIHNLYRFSMFLIGTYIVALTYNTCTYTVDSRGKYTLEAGASDSAGNKASIKYDYVYGTGINWIIVGIIAGVLVLLALAILLIRRRNANS